MFNAHKGLLKGVCVGKNITDIFFLGKMADAFINAQGKMHKKIKQQQHSL